MGMQAMQQQAQQAAAATGAPDAAWGGPCAARQAAAAAAAAAKAAQEAESENLAEKRFFGTIRKFFGDQYTGYGFIDCPESRMRFGYDVYIHGRQLHGCEKGDEVCFNIVRNNKGEPQARNLYRMKDEKRFLEKRDNNKRKQEEMLAAKWGGGSDVQVGGGGGVMTEEQAKKFQQALRGRR